MRALKPPCTAFFEVTVTATVPPFTSSSTSTSSTSSTTWSVLAMVMQGSRLLTSTPSWSDLNVAQVRLSGFTSPSAWVLTVKLSLSLAVPAKVSEETVAS